MILGNKKVYIAGKGNAKECVYFKHYTKKSTQKKIYKTINCVKNLYSMIRMQKRKCSLGAVYEKREMIIEGNILIIKKKFLFCI